MSVWLTPLEEVNCILAIVARFNIFIVEDLVEMEMDSHGGL